MKPARLLVNIDVGDLAAAERFYCAAFGLAAGRRFDGAVELLGADAPLYLLAKAAGTEERDIYFCPTCQPLPAGTA